MLSKVVEERWCLGGESFKAKSEGTVGLVEGEDERDLRELGKHLVCCVQMSNLKATVVFTQLFYPSFVRLVSWVRTSENLD